MNKALLLRFLGFVMTLILVCCQKENLKALVQENPPVVLEVPLAKVSADFCTTESSKIDTNVKFLFVIDKSGSNQDNITGPGTDPDGSRRYLPLLSFLQKRKSEKNMYFAILNFSTEPSRVVEDGRPMFTNDASAFSATVEKQRNPEKSTPPHPTDEGWTNYKDTLSEVQKIIQEDVELEKKKENPLSSNYIIFFVSDGAPVVSQDDNGKYVMQTQDEVLATVSGVTSLQKTYGDLIDSITLHSAYYYASTADPAAKQYMQAISQLAQGTFQEFSGTTQVNFEDYTVPQRNAKNNLMGVFLENRSTVWESGQLLADSDGDGISDAKEIVLGSDPLSADSDSNGLSDGVEYFAFGKPCKSEKCLAKSAEVKKECNAWKVAKTGASAQTSAPLFQDTDNDGLNDCEEFVLNSDRKKFDSNFDGIPDWLSFKSRVAFVAGTNEANLDPDFDGVSNLNEIKFGTPVMYRNASFVDLHPLRYTLEKISESDSKSCYHLAVDSIKILPLLGGKENAFRVSLIESNVSISGRQNFRTAEKIFNSPPDGFVDFSETDFH